MLPMSSINAKHQLGRGGDPRRCTQLLERHVLAGNSLCAELYRLSLTAPVEFFQPTSSQFAKLLIDFSYFETRQTFEKFTQEDEEGRQLDEKFFSTFSPFLRNFGRFLDQLHNFIVDFADFTSNFAIYREQFARLKRLDELELHSAQVLYLLGLLLLLVDFKFPDASRERIFVAVYRLRLDFDSNRLQTLVGLLRNRREPFETAFPGLGLNEHFLGQIFTFLRFYKGPRHGWLENALYVCLYFEPGHDTLSNQFSVMRQIIDNFFADRWNLHFHINFRVNLYEKWGRFKAASAALSSATTDFDQTTRLASEYLRQFRDFPLPNGLLSLEHFGEYEKRLVELNAGLKWLILHSSTDDSSLRAKKLASNLAPKVDIQKEILLGLKQLAQFEFKFAQASAHLSTNREDNLNKLKQRIVDNFDQILAFLRSSTSANSSSSRRTGRIIGWLETIRTSVAEMAVSDTGDAPTTLQRLDSLRTRIAEVLQGQSDGPTDQQQLILRQSLLGASADLQRLQNIYGLMDEVAVREMAQMTDSVYLFRFVDEHCAQMERLLREDALSVKFIFLKMANSIPNLIVCGQMPEGKRQKLASFYYKVLELQLRSVIQAIPRAIFEEMTQLNDHFSADTERQVHVDKARIREFADLPRRRKLSELTFQITRLALGIANTCLKQLGDVQIQPRALLCDGLREELRKRLAAILSDPGQSSVFRALQAQHVQLAQFRKAFLFVCDHVGIRDGIQIWTVQLSSTIRENLARKYAQIATQGPGPCTAVSPSNQPETLIVRFFDFLLAQTRPSQSCYCRMDSVWRAAVLSDSQQNNNIRFNYTAFAILKPWMLFGLGTLLGLVLNNEVQKVVRTLNRQFASGQKMPLLTTSRELRQFVGSSSPELAIDGPNKEMLQWLAHLGQLRLLLANLQLFMEAEARSQLGIVFEARRTLTRSIQLPVGSVGSSTAENPRGSTLQQFSSLPQSTELLELVPKLVQIRHAKCHIFLLSVILRFSLRGSLAQKNEKKHREFLDPYPVVQGALLLLEQSPTWNHFLHSNAEEFLREKPTNQRHSLLTVVP